MFRRLPAGLPKDPGFPSDLKKLGYFVNENDEIRKIDDPKSYFKFFLTRNDRHNCMQREAMNESIRKIVHTRLTDLNLEKLILPFGATLTDPHVPIYISHDLPLKKRVVILFYEHTQDLGILAHRIIGGKGGINEGTAINLVKYIQAQESAPGKSDAPGIILANIGQLLWSRKKKKALSQTSWLSLPQASSVEQPYIVHDELNRIPGNATTAEHVNYIFNYVVEQMCDRSAKLDVIGVSEGAVKFFEFLDDFENFAKWSRRVEAFAAVATYCHLNDVRNSQFANWLMDYGRAYILSEEPATVFLAGPEGSKRGKVPAFGCPVFSLGEPHYTESILPKGYKTIIDWFQEVAADPEYCNPSFKRVTFGADGKEVEEEEDDEDEDEEVEETAEEKASKLAWTECAKEVTPKVEEIFDNDKEEDEVKEEKTVVETAQEKVEDALGDVPNITASVKDALAKG